MPASPTTVSLRDDWSNKATASRTARHSAPTASKLENRPKPATCACAIPFGTYQRGRSQPKVYNHGTHRNSLYFGDLDRPVERNVFNGSHASLQSLWQQHGLRLN